MFLVSQFVTSVCLSWRLGEGSEKPVFHAIALGWCLLNGAGAIRRGGPQGVGHFSQNRIHGPFLRAVPVSCDPPSH